MHDAPPSQRNACLYVAAVALGQLVAGGSLPEPEAFAEPLEVNADRPPRIGAPEAIARRTFADLLS